MRFGTKHLLILTVVVALCFTFDPDTYIWSVIFLALGAITWWTAGLPWGEPRLLKLPIGVFGAAVVGTASYLFDFSHKFSYLHITVAAICAIGFSAGIKIMEFKSLPTPNLPSPANLAEREKMIVVGCIAVTAIAVVLLGFFQSIVSVAFANLLVFLSFVRLTQLRLDDERIKRRRWLNKLGKVSYWIAISASIICGGLVCYIIGSGEKVIAGILILGYIGTISSIVALTGIAIESISSPSLSAARISSAIFVFACWITPIIRSGLWDVS